MKKASESTNRNPPEKRSSFFYEHTFLLFSFLTLSTLVLIMAIVLFDNFMNFHTKWELTVTYMFGTLETDPAKASEEYAAGVRVAMQSIGWSNYEPADGVFNEAYMDDVKNSIKMDLAAGLKVVISPAIQYPPSWVMNLPGAHYVNQYGVTASPGSAGGYGDPNFVFSQTVRDKVAQFETHVMQQLAADPEIGYRNIWAIRYVNGPLGEALYPLADDQQGHNNSYWAYDANAQGQGRDRPATIPANPFPGWVPGDTTYHGQPFSTAQVRQWYNWYLNALIDFINWHTELYRNPHGINYQGYLQLLTPGVGARAFEYNGSIARYLDGSRDPNGTVSRAAVWYKIYPALVDKTGIVAYVTSMADGSGIPQNDGCHGGEAQVNYATDPQVDTWSAVRYISGLADKYGMLKSGENPGSGGQNQGVVYGLAMMQTAARQMQSCHFQGMFWAHDSDLYDGRSGVTLQDYANVIASYNTSIGI